MSNFIELSTNDVLCIDGGGFWSKVAYASSAWGAYELSGACFAAITTTAPAIATAGLITGGLAFGVVAAICVGGIFFG